MAYEKKIPRSFVQRCTCCVYESKKTSIVATNIVSTDVHHELYVCKMSTILHRPQCVNNLYCILSTAL